MSKRHRPDRRTVLRYLGLQLPGWGFLLIAGEAAHVFLDVPQRWVWIVLGAWIGTIDITRGRAMLVGPENEAVVLLAQVPGTVRFAQNTHLG